MGKAKAVAMAKKRVQAMARAAARVAESVLVL
jgi:hypothetical protein